MGLWGDLIPPVVQGGGGPDVIALRKKIKVLVKEKGQYEVKLQRLKEVGAPGVSVGAQSHICLVMKVFQQKVNDFKIATYELLGWNMGICGCFHDFAALIRIISNEEQWSVSA